MMHKKPIELRLCKNFMIVIYFFLIQAFTTFPRANIPMIDSSRLEKRQGGDPCDRRREATECKGTSRAARAPTPSLAGARVTCGTGDGCFSLGLPTWLVQRKYIGNGQYFDFSRWCKKNIRTSTLSKLYNRHIFFAKPGLYNFPKANMLGMVNKICRRCIKNRLNLDFAQSLCPSCFSVKPFSQDFPRVNILGMINFLNF